LTDAQKTELKSLTEKTSADRKEKSAKGKKDAAGPTTAPGAGISTTGRTKCEPTAGLTASAVSNLARQPKQEPPVKHRRFCSFSL